MRALLALADGTIFGGESFTGPGESSGEVIFNTGLTGYQEVLTYPSYVGQMVCMTSVHVGNYGVNLEDVESDRVQVESFLVKECCREPSNWRSKESLPSYLMRHGVMGVEGLDTRALTRHIRIHGAQQGILSTNVDNPQELVARAKALAPMEGTNLAARVTPKQPYTWDGQKPQPATLNYTWKTNGPKLVVFDFGIKWNMLRLLTAQGFECLMVPAETGPEAVRKLAPDAIFFSSGPGDPATLGDTIDTMRNLIPDFPVGGICLGHQLLGLALGGRTYKLKFGHHGLNHPVKNLASGRIEISSQNHGFCVDLASVENIRTTHVNLNDNTLEGFEHTKRPLMAIQHHPEAGPGPHDCRSFFPRFREMIREATGK